VAFGNLAAGCTAAPASAPYSGLASGGGATVNVTVNCQDTPLAGKYAYRTVWGAIAGGQVTLTLSFDPTTLNDPLVNEAGPDDIKTFQAVVGYPTARLQWLSCANAATGANGFTNINSNEISAGQVSLLNFKNGAGATTAVTLAVCTFAVKSGAASSASSQTTLTAINSSSGPDLIPNTDRVEGTLAIP
jgi:hypothetical protein